MIRFLQTLDRRWIFLAMFIAVALPIYLQVAYPVTTTSMVRSAFEVVDALPEGSNVMVALDYDPGSKAELHPMAIALARHLCLRKANLFLLTLWPGGGPLVDSIINNNILGEFNDYAYGKNVVDLGYKPGNEMVIKVLANDLRSQFANDKRGNSLASLPMARDVRSVQDMKMIVSVSGGTPGTKEWIQYAGDMFRIPVVAGTTGVQSTQLFPYFPNQLAGLLPAVKGAAEYETLLGDKYAQYRDAKFNAGLRKMAPQLWGHLLMMLLVIVGNVIYFATKRKGGTP